MIAEEHPTIRYVSPRGWIRKATCLEQTFHASLREFTASHLAFLEQLTGSIGIVINTIEATMRTEGLLQLSQQLAGELQAQQKELQQTN